MVVLCIKPSPLLWVGSHKKFMSTSTTASTKDNARLNPFKYVLRVCRGKGEESPNAAANEKQTAGHGTEEEGSE